jgi:hypothetical protein|tara:strand:- start:504 stop:722 length:219 start_codon:yes stop_codon:yes gene_type:complete
MFEGILNLEKATLERLTNERRASGSIPQEVDNTLSMLGVHWDEIDQEYFSMDKYQAEVYEILLAEYTRENYA